MKLRKRFFPLILIVLLLSVGLYACKKTPDDPENASHDPDDAVGAQNKVTIGAYLSETQNPLSIQTAYNEQLNHLLYDSLYELNETYEPLGNLASGYEVKDGGYTVNVSIQPNVTFHDGSPLTAHDVKATIQYLLEHSGYYSYHVRNIKSVQVLDADTVQLALSFLTPDIRLQLTFPIVCKKELLNGADFQINGTGPYQPASETKGKQMILSLNENYHRAFPTKVKKIEVAMIPDQETARALSGSGILDIYYAAFFDEGFTTVTKYESDKRDFLTDEYTFLMLNYNTAHMQEKKFRKALSKSISRESIRDEIFMSHAEAAYLPFPPGSFAYNDTQENTRNAEDAKALLGELGYSDLDNNGVLEIHEGEANKELILDILSIDDPLKHAVCELLCHDLLEIGISLQTHYVPKEEFEAVMQEQKHDLYLVTTNIGYDLDPTPFFTGVFAAPLDLEYSSYLAKLAVADKLEQKQPEYMRLCDVFYENMLHIPLVFLKNTLLTTTKLKSANALSPTHLYDSILKQEP